MINVAYATVMALLAASVFMLPDLGAFSWAAIGLVSAGAVVLGARRYAGSPLVWWLLAAGILAQATGDTLYGAVAHNGPDLVPTLADACYLAMYPLIIAGLVVMMRGRTGLTDWSRLLDVLVFLCAAGLLIWVFLTAPAVAAGQLSGEEKSALAAYNVGDLLILVTTVRLVFVARRGAALVLLALGAAALLAGDVAYTLDQLGAGWHPGDAADVSYLVFYASWGAAALQPSMVRIVAPEPAARDSVMQVRWAVLLSLSLAIPPGLLIGEALTGGGVPDAAIVGVISALMAALVVTRLVNALTQHRRALSRERALRHASATLLSALTPTGVDAALHEAVAALLPPDTAAGVVVALPESRASDPPVTAVGRRTGVVDPAELPAALRERIAGYPAALVCPLGVAPPEAEGAGLLLVAADRKLLAAVEDSVEVLAAQAALALDRIVLTEQIHRRDSDHYLRTITRNSVDMVLIVDDDLGIRYASASVASMFGLDLPLPTNLQDLARAGGAEQITRTLTTARRAPQADGVRDWWRLQRADGSTLTLEVNCRDLRQDRTVRGYVLTMRDSTQDDAHQRDVLQQALANRLR